MMPNYELFLHGFNAMAVGPEAPPLPLAFKLVFGGVFAVLSAIALAV